MLKSSSHTLAMVRLFEGIFVYEQAFFSSLTHARALLAARLNVVMRP
jgi:hypothetical protein